MNYEYAVLSMCDECRSTLLKQNIDLTDLGAAKNPSCKICGKNKVFTKSILTNHKEKSKKSYNEGNLVILLKDVKSLQAKTPRSVQEGFQLLALEDSLESRA